MKKPRNDGDFPFWRVWLIAQWILLAGLLLFVVLTVRGQQPAPDASLLSLRQAAEMALAPGGSLQIQIAQQMADQAKARVGQSRADLFPNVDGTLSQSSQTRNLQALGIQFALPLPGFEAPRFVGPFQVFDARLSATQSIFHFSAIRRYQAAKAGANAAAAQEAQIRELVLVAVAKAYFAVQRAQAQHQAALSALDLAKELEALALQQKEAGTGIALEVTRAAVQRSQAEQALLLRGAELSAAKLQLLRAMGSPLDAHPISVETMRPPMEDAPALPQALSVALGERYDMRGQKSRAHSAHMLHSSAKWERAPQLLAFGDYGVSGNVPAGSLPTRSVGVMVRIPVFDGGRRDARSAELAAKLREEELRTRDLEQQVELELRLALDALQSTGQQVMVATEAEAQTRKELEQARRRYEAGVSSSLEVTRAQTAAEQMRATRIDALYRYHVARADCALAMGRTDMLLQ